VNAHAAHKEAIAPMPDWIVEAIAKLVTPEAKALYRNFGYPSLPG
jgi:hypothetical protein